MTRFEALEVKPTLGSSKCTAIPLSVANPLESFPKRAGTAFLANHWLQADR
jgi:hypothetical protein